MTRIIEEIYLAVWYDRHEDDEYHAFLLETDAIDWCRVNAKSYKNYEFYELTEDSGIIDDEWLFYMRTDSDDGPKLYVKKIPMF